MDRRFVKVVDKPTGHMAEILGVAGYVLLEDSWITEHDKVLECTRGKKYNVLDYKQQTVTKHYGNPQYGTQYTREVPVTALKLDRDIEVGSYLTVFI